MSNYSANHGRTLFLISIEIIPNLIFWLSTIRSTCRSIEFYFLHSTNAVENLIAIIINWDYGQVEPSWGATQQRGCTEHTQMGVNLIILFSAHKFMLSGEAKVGTSPSQRNDAKSELKEK